MAIPIQSYAHPKSILVVFKGTLVVSKHRVAISQVVQVEGNFNGIFATYLVLHGMSALQVKKRLYRFAQIIKANRNVVERTTYILVVPFVKGLAHL